jgi:hypothetical protein
LETKKALAWRCSISNVTQQNRFLFHYHRVFTPHTTSVEHENGMGELLPSVQPVELVRLEGLGLVGSYLAGKGSKSISEVQVLACWLIQVE